MSLAAPIIYDPYKHADYLPQAAQIHADCITQDYTMVTFLDVSDPDKLLKYWRNLSEEVLQGRRAIILQLAPNLDTGEDEVAGCVALYMPETETGPFRSEVQKLLVSPRHRRKGVASRMMKKLEEVALEKHRELLLLDTTIGSGADLVYPKLGYKPVGTVPKYGYSPKDRRLVDQIFFYKDLRDEK